MGQSELGFRIIHDHQMAHAGARGAAANRAAVQHQDFQPRAGALGGASRADNAGSHDDDVKRRVQRRMPQQNGSCSFRMSVDSALTKAVPVIEGMISLPLRR